MEDRKHNRIVSIGSEGVISFYDWIKKIPSPNLAHDQILARCLLGQYKALVFIEEKPVGIMIFESNGDTVFIVGLYLPGKYKKFYEDGIAMLKGVGFKKMRCVSMEHRETLFNLPAKYTVYEGNI